MIPPVELFTERLILRAVTPALIHELYNNWTKEDIKRFFGFDEAVYEHAKAMHEKGMETYRLTLFYFVLVHKETQTPMGECGFHTLNKTHRRTELFYQLRNEADRGKGLMKEALEAVLDYGFTLLDLHRIEALTAS